jgi:predicted RecA/RadA family phage recombinase
MHPDAAVRDRLHALWNRWTDRAGAAGLTDSYGLQALALRAMVESGESFAQLRFAEADDGPPLTIDILDREPVPTELNGGGWRRRLCARAASSSSGCLQLCGITWLVPRKTAAAGETVTIATTDVFDVPKLASAVIAAGDPLAWDDLAKELNAPGTGRHPTGIAIEAAGNGATIVRVGLDGWRRRSPAYRALARLAKRRSSCSS